MYEFSSREERREKRTLGLEDTQDLVSGDEADLGDSVRVAEGDADLGGGQALASELGDLLDDLLGGSLEPRRGRAAVREGGGRYDCVLCQSSV